MDGGGLGRGYQWIRKTQQTPTVKGCRQSWLKRVCWTWACRRSSSNTARSIETHNGTSLQLATVEKQQQQTAAAETARVRPVRRSTCAAVLCGQSGVCCPPSFTAGRSAKSFASFTAAAIFLIFFLFFFFFWWQCLMVRIKKLLMVALFFYDYYFWIPEQKLDFLAVFHGEHPLTRIDRIAITMCRSTISFFSPSSFPAEISLSSITMETDSASTYCSDRRAARWITEDDFDFVFNSFFLVFIRDIAATDAAFATLGTANGSGARVTHMAFRMFKDSRDSADEEENCFVKTDESIS